MIYLIKQTYKWEKLKQRNTNLLNATYKWENKNK